MTGHVRREANELLAVITGRYSAVTHRGSAPLVQSRRVQGGHTSAPELAGRVFFSPSFPPHRAKDSRAEASEVACQ